MSDLLTNQAPPNLTELTVSQLAGSIRRTLEDAFERVRVRGELGRVVRHGNGHIYVDLKDDKACINSVIWRSQALSLKVKPEEGLEVVATGRVSSYAPQSKYQLIIEEMELAGAGALMALLERRRKMLAAEGLFDEARKKNLPYLPEVIGVITSPTGAVIRDIMHRLRARFPRRVLLWPVVVQGERAAAEIAAAIAGLNRLAVEGAVPRPDLLIVARGGGSIEDLWAFNEEILVRAVAASVIPIISAVGHETDTTLIDFAADARAPTPTAAAEMAVPVRADLVQGLMSLERRHLLAVRRLIAERRRHVEGLARGLPKPESLIGEARQRFDGLARRLPNALRARAANAEARFARIAGRVQPGLLTGVVRAHRRALAIADERFSRAFARQMREQRSALARGRTRLDSVVSRLRIAAGLTLSRARRRLDHPARLMESLSFERTLERGFAVVSDNTGKLLRDGAAAIGAGEVEIRFKDDDRVRARVAEPAKSPKKAKKPLPPVQGKLL